MITLAEARKIITALIGIDPGELDGFLLVLHQPEDSYAVAGSIECEHCRAGFLTEAAVRVLAGCPHRVVSADRE